MTILVLETIESQTFWSLDFELFGIPIVGLYVATLVSDLFWTIWIQD